MEAQENESISSFLKKKWYVVVDDVVDGFAISSTDKPLSEHNYRRGERHWIEVAAKEIADYIVISHNRTL
jgi:hypothetical protein